MEQYSFDKGVSVVSANGKTAVSVQVCAREDRRLEALARRAAGNLSVSNIRHRDDNTWILNVTSENVRVRNILQLVNDSLLVISVGGEGEAAQPILASIKQRP